MIINVKPSKKFILLSTIIVLACAFMSFDVSTTYAIENVDDEIPNFVSCYAGDDALIVEQDKSVLAHKPKPGDIVEMSTYIVTYISEQAIKDGEKCVFPNNITYASLELYYKNWPDPIDTVGTYNVTNGKPTVVEINVPVDEPDTAWTLFYCWPDDYGNKKCLPLDTDIVHTEFLGDEESEKDALALIKCYPDVNKFTVDVLSGYKYKVTGENQNEVYIDLTGNQISSDAQKYAQQVLSVGEFINEDNLKGSGSVNIKVEVIEPKNSRYRGKIASETCGYNYIDGYCSVMMQGGECVLTNNGCKGEDVPLYDPTNCNSCKCVDSIEYLKHNNDDDWVEKKLPHMDFRAFSIPNLKSFSFDNLQNILGSIYKFLIALAVVASIFILPYVAVLFATATPENIKKGKEWLTSLITGLLLLMFASILIKIVINFITG